MASWRQGGRLTAVAGVVTLFVGCAPEATPLLREDLDQFRADLRRVEQEIQTIRSALLTEIQATDRRTAQSLTELQRGVARLGARLDDVGRETGQLQGRVDELRRRVDALALQFDAAGAPPGAGAGPSSPSATVAQRAPPPGAQASDLYQTAYIDFTRGNYNLAVAAFREYLRLYPTTSLAENAQYWIGESHFSLARAHQARGEAERATQELERAVQEFRKVVVAYPRGDRVPAALYKEALALAELGQAQLAEARLQFLMDQFPKREEAAKAKDELARIRKR